MIPVLFFVIVITFVLMHLAPGGPWDREGKQLTPQVINNLNIKYGLDKPLPQQFLTYIWGVVHFDFGDSLRSPGQHVSQRVLESWPYTFTLGAVTFLLLVPLGIGLGVVAALRQNSVADYAALGLATAAASTPNFVIGIFLIIFLALGMNRLTGGTFYLPTGGMPQPSSENSTSILFLPDDWAAICTEPRSPSGKACTAELSTRLVSTWP